VGWCARGRTHFSGDGVLRMLGGGVVVEGVVLVHEAFLAAAVASGHKKTRKVDKRWRIE